MNAGKTRNSVSSTSRTQFEISCLGCKLAPFKVDFRIEGFKPVLKGNSKLINPEVYSSNVLAVLKDSLMSGFQLCSSSTGFKLV